ncbi:MAG TPA: ParB N-terminal domain-containing protein, partial [Methyloceanibacter sp.]|nr:ParB N-terminal domain-containing protein [Methyloceanibacter sp.]
AAMADLHAAEDELGRQTPSDVDDTGTTVPPPPGGEDASATASDTAEAVYEQLIADFPPEAIEWAKSARWEGPVDVPLGQIDFSNRAAWGASGEPDKVATFADKISSGKMKPLVLVRVLGKKKLMIADGHHRALAYQRLGKPARAFIATVDAKSGPWDEMHAAQRSGTQSGVVAKPAAAARPTMMPPKLAAQPARKPAQAKPAAVVTLPKGKLLGGRKAA